MKCGSWANGGFPFSTGGRYSLGHSIDNDGDGYSGCQGDCDDGNAAVNPAALDVCDGLDNECDGTVDEEFVPEATTCGVGSCAATGSTICTDGVVVNTCQPGAPASDDSSCDGMDSDCDGTTDEDTAPVVEVNLAPQMLWPSNHRMVDVHAAVTVVGCPTAGPRPVAVLTSVASSEADDAQESADGGTTDDIQGAQIGTPDFDLQLRAERRGSGNGRIYSLTYAASDTAGHTPSATGFVFVPHDQRGEVEPVMVTLAMSEGGTVLSWAHVPDAGLYNVVRGEVGNLRESQTAIDLGPVMCIEANSVDASTAGNEDHDVPAVGHAFFYLVAYEDAWGNSGYGTVSTTKPRVVGSGDCR